MRAGSRPRARGFTYFGVLLVIAFMGIALAAAGEVWSTSAQRDKEAELLFAGDAIRAAIRSYYTHGPSPAYPQSFDELIQDPRFPSIKRHLRHLYVDPMTGQADWEIIRDANGAMMGVASTSKKKPIKRANFPTLDEGFKDAECYCSWQFTFEPRFGRRPR
jgi:type II secretory pathway pseudopilin PulG